MDEQRKQRSLKLANYRDLATKSNPELGAFENTLVNYYTGRTNATFEDHEGDSAEDTALFLASARTIVLDLLEEYGWMQAYAGFCRSCALSGEKPVDFEEFKKYLEKG